MVRAAQLADTDLVLEIGAGEGDLTRSLARACRRVVAYEVDPDVVLNAPSTGDYGRWSRLTVLTWPAYRWELAGRIPRHKFQPVPTVDSGILRLERRPSPLVPSGQTVAYRRFVELGFSGVGGSLHASLRQRYPGRRLDGAFRAACSHDQGVPVVARATTGTP